LVISQSNLFFCHLEMDLSNIHSYGLFNLAFNLALALYTKLDFPNNGPWKFIGNFIKKYHTRNGNIFGDEQFDIVLPFFFFIAFFVLLNLFYLLFFFIKNIC
jgi:hypothetical protein